jgi:hypothetical protein
MNARSRVFACIAAVAVTACAESLAPQRDVAAVPPTIKTPVIRALASALSGGNSPSSSAGKATPAGSRPSFDETLPDSADAVANGWLALVTAYSESWFEDAGTVRGYGYTYYFGNYATMTLNLQVWKDGGMIGSATPQVTSRNPILPVPGDWEDYIAIPNSIQCGLGSAATAGSHSEVDVLGTAGMLPISKADDSH